MPHSHSLWLIPTHPRKRQYKMTRARPVPPGRWFQTSHSTFLLAGSQEFLCCPDTKPSDSDGFLMWEALLGWSLGQKPPLLAGTSTADLGSKQVVDSCRKQWALCPWSERSTGGDLGCLLLLQTSHSPSSSLVFAAFGGLSELLRAVYSWVWSFSEFFS